MGYQLPVSILDLLDPVQPLFYVYVSAARLVARLADLRKTAQRLSIICPLLSRDRDRDRDHDRDRDRERSNRDVPSVVPLILDSISSHPAPL